MSGNDTGLLTRIRSGVAHPDDDTQTGITLVELLVSMMLLGLVMAMVCSATPESSMILRWT